MTLTDVQLDRAIGAVVASAAGDALGSQYEFGPEHPDTMVPEFGVGVFGHAPPAWRARLHGWPGYSAEDLATEVRAAVGRGIAD